MSKFNTAILALGILGLGLLLVNHWVHAFGLLPYLVLLACPVLHLFHRGHRGHAHATAADGKVGTP